MRILVELNPVLAGRCLHEGRAKVATPTRAAVTTALLETMAQPEVALRVRIAAGEVLGHLGDPRLGNLVTIEVGEFVMGGDGQSDGKPQHTLNLPYSYQIGQYPVTNTEFAHFIEAGGYQEPRWWTESGWQDKAEKGYTEPPIGPTVALTNRTSRWWV